LAKKSTIQLSLFDFGEPEPLPKTIVKETIKAPSPPPNAETKAVSFVMPNNVNTHIINVNTPATPNIPTLPKEEPIIKEPVIAESPKEEIVINEAVEKIEEPKKELEIIEEPKIVVEQKEEIIKEEVAIIEEKEAETINDPIIIEQQKEKVKEETTVFNTVENLPKLPSANVELPNLITENITQLENKQIEIIEEPTIPEPKTIKRIKPEIINQKPKTVNAQTLQKRGRKSQADMATEANFISIPADDILYSKHYYSIGQVATMFNANVSKIRFWEEQLSTLLKVRKNRKGDRYFTPDNIKTLQQIYNLTSKQGLTMGGAAKYMQHQKSNLNQKDNLVQELIQLKQFLLSIETGLKA
jgi:DNA-binding transcriptional MerR regulator